MSGLHHPRRAAAPPLRVGLTFESSSLPTWVVSLVRGLLRAECVSIEIVLVGRNRVGLNPAGSALFRLYERVDRVLTRLERDAGAAEPLDASRFSARSREIDFESIGGRIALTSVAVRAVKDARLDLLLWFPRRLPQNRLFEIPRYGVWVYHYGRVSGLPDAPPLIWELCERNPVARSLLLAFDRQDTGPRVLFDSNASTYLGSLRKCRSPVFWKSREFALRCLRDLVTGGKDWFASRPRIQLGAEPKRGSPSSLRMLRFFFGLAARVLRNRLRVRLFNEQWVLAIRPAEGASKGVAFAASPTLILPPSDRLYADPFLIERDGETFVFFEDLKIGHPHAIISYARVLDDGTITQPKCALRRPYHLSYPFLLEHGGDVFMIPESAENRTVELHRATAFPHQWELDTVLLSDIRAVDATVIEHDGRWWMFANVSASGGSINDELYLFYARSLRGAWMSHRRNPIVSDVRRARPAGGIFRRDGNWIRPAQDCSGRYGGRISLNRIEVMTDLDYRESHVAWIEPDWHDDVYATHTVNRSQRYEVFDGLIRRRK